VSHEFRNWWPVARVVVQSVALQILLCSPAFGLKFAAIENLMYLHVYTRQPSAALARWR
jgi:hypothetical protein